VVGADIPTVQRAQVGNAVDAAGITLLPTIRMVRMAATACVMIAKYTPPTPALEHRSAIMKAKSAGTRMIAASVSGKLWNGFQNNGSLRDLIPVHEIGDARR